MSEEFDAAGLEAKVRAHVERNMDAATLWLKGQVQRKINRGNADGTDPSSPGEPPKKVSGRLFQSIATGKEVSEREIVGRVGSNVKYARRQEMGFVGTDAAGRQVSQAPRPYFRPSLAENLAKLGKIISRA